MSRQHFQIACQRYFEATHNTEVDSGIQHPNQYFIESQKILNGEVKERTAKGIHKVQTIRATLPAKVEKPEVADNTTATLEATNSDEELCSMDF